MPTEQCVFLILYIHSIYGILYMYITKYSCVFLKLGESIYVAMDLIPILLGSLPLAHNAQHSLVMYAVRYIRYGIYTGTRYSATIIIGNSSPLLRCINFITPRGFALH